jgi:hypothetical protein
MNNRLVKPERNFGRHPLLCLAKAGKSSGVATPNSMALSIESQKEGRVIVKNDNPSCS